MNLESPKVSVQKSAQELFNLLSDVKNFEQLMPGMRSPFRASLDVISDLGIQSLNLEGTSLSFQPWLLIALNSM